MNIEERRPTGERTSPLQYFINSVEADLQLHERHPEIQVRYQAFFESLGGVALKSLPVSSDVVAMAKPYSPLNKSAMMQPVFPYFPIKRTVINTFRLVDILAAGPAYPDFWLQTADEDVVSHAVYSQEPQFETDTNGLLYIGGEKQVSFPDSLIQISSEGTARVLFIPPKGIVFQYPHCLAGGMFTFRKVPDVIRRATEMYAQECNSQGGTLFMDVNPDHASYKGRRNVQRIAVVFEINEPYKMRIEKELWQ